MGISAQTLDVELPYYAGRDYYFCLLQGSGTDTIATGELDTYGKASIDLSGRYSSYRGVGRFSVKECGKIWNIVINGRENVVMSEAASGSPGGEGQEASPVFEGSAENRFLLDALTLQNKIIREYVEVSGHPQNQNPSYVLASPEQRMQKIENEYKAFRKEINDSPLYAARIVEILNCLSGTGSSFNVSQEGILEELRDFIVGKVDFGDLYTSGFWQPVFEVWVQTSVNDSLLLSNARYMLDRCGNDIHIRREVTQAIIRMFSRYAKDNLLAGLGTEYLTMPLNGQPAPEIVTAEGSFLPKNSLVVFYETGCGNCHNELEALKRKYALLTGNRIRVISIAADMDRDVFVETSTGFPWADRLCDFEGFNGDNFRNYGIVGTPTFILTDGEGIVRGRYAQLKELIKD
jgi:hypothetical protein